MPRKNVFYGSETRGISSGIPNVEGKLEGTLEEEKILNNLFLLLDARAAHSQSYKSFRFQLRYFLDNAEVAQKINQEGIEATPKALSAYAELRILQETRIGGEVVGAAMKYIQAKYPRFAK